MEKIISLLTFEIRFTIYFSCLVALIIGDLVYFVIKKRQKQSNRVTGFKTTIRDSNLNLTLGLILNSTILALSFLGIFGLFNYDPKVIETYPTQNGVLNNYEQPIQIKFSTPVDFSKLKTNSNPSISGVWEFQKYHSLIPFGRIITFKPDRHYNSDQKVMLYFANITKPYSRKYGSEFLLEFIAHPKPLVTESNPANGDSDIRTDQDLIFQLSNNNGKYIDWDLDIDPPAKYHIIHKENELIIRFTERLTQGTNYKINLYQNPDLSDFDSINNIKIIKIPITKISFTTVKPPFITSFKPDGEVLPDEPIIITFDQQMDQNSSLAKIEITPNINGSFSWLGNNILKFTPDIWPIDTNIKITFKKGLASVSKGILNNDIEYNFKTIGEVKLINSDPINNAKNISPLTDISLTFNQAVEEQSTASKFSISPTTPGQLRWSDNTLTFYPTQPLVYDTKYQITLPKEIKSKFGKDSTNDISISFKTSPETYLIDVPYMGQKELFTCNIAAARMLLAYRNINISEAELKKEIGINGQRGNGNPHLGFTENYGTYWEPIAKAVSKYRPYRLFEKWNLTDLLAEISQGNPVMIWGQNGWSDPHELSWTNPDGTQIYAINGMHSSVVRGYTGPKSHPMEIIINDPWRGVTSISTAEFTRRWSFFTAALVID